MADVEDLRTMYHAHGPALFAYLARRVGRDLAEDLLAETFRVAIEAFRTFDPQRGSAQGWLFGIGTNLLRRHWRTEQRRLLALARSAPPRRGIDPLLSLADDVARRVDAENDAERLLRAVVSLSTSDRDLLILSGWERLTSGQIGEALGIAPSSVRSRLHRIRQELHAAIDDQPSTSHPETEAT